MSTKTKVLLCGGGNAIHVLISYLSSKPEYEVNVLSLFPGEAQRLIDTIPEEGVKCINDLGPDVFGKPDLVTDDPAQASPGANIIIFAVPSFTHDLYLHALKPQLQPGFILGAFPGEGGFDISARHILGDDLVSQSSLFAMETLPWACRIVEYGKSVEVLGTKKQIDLVVTPKDGTTDVTSTVEMLQKIVGQVPILIPDTSFLAVTLMNINSVWHPTISYGYYRNRDVKELMDEPPLFYQGADEFTGEMLAKVSDEVLHLGKVLQEKYPGLKLNALHHVRDWMLASYGDDIGDKTSIYTMLISNKGYRGLTHPTVPVVQDDGTTKYLPNFKYRYFTEDLPMGLVVTRGIAELAGVPTPEMDKVIIWAQTVMEKEYITPDGKLAGKDLDSTRCPQKYGITDLDTLMKNNRYV